MPAVTDTVCRGRAEGGDAALERPQVGRRGAELPPHPSRPSRPRRRWLSPAAALSGAAARPAARPALGLAPPARKARGQKGGTPREEPRPRGRYRPGGAGVSTRARRGRRPCSGREGPQGAPAPPPAGRSRERGAAGPEVAPGAAAAEHPRRDGNPRGSGDQVGLPPVWGSRAPVAVSVGGLM